MAGFSKLFIGTSVGVAGAAVQVVDWQQRYSYNIPRVKYITIIPPISKIHIYTSARLAIVYHSDKNYGNTKSPLQFLTKVQTFYKKSRLLAKSFDFL